MMSNFYMENTNEWGLINGFDSIDGSLFHPIINLFLSVSWVHLFLDMNIDSVPQTWYEGGTEVLAKKTLREPE